MALLTICLEPGSRFFRLKYSNDGINRFSSYLVREAETGDGIVLPEDFDAKSATSSFLNIYPWGSSGDIKDFKFSRVFLKLLSKKFSPAFRRTHWKIILPPFLLTEQGHTWAALLREAHIRRFEFVTNLGCIAGAICQTVPAAFLHWGASGADLGICLQSEVYCYRRLTYGENFLVAELIKWFRDEVRIEVSEAEVLRILTIVSASGLAVSTDLFIEVGVLGKEELDKLSLAREDLISVILEFLQPLFEVVEGFIRCLSAEDQGQLFRHGLKLSGGGLALELIRDYLAEIFEFPVSSVKFPEEAALWGAYSNP